ncbi:type IVB secretion system protein IcmH/DotU [Gilvimarinus sp. F26214L]|uniref:type IVB secretion system protein IcmH/DotU n=1 Tax=Gilvimarinus sp. DZF01 TaxID=3461371 RepID=UPI0040452DF2
MDDSDQTVFKQPMPGGDRTVMRPRPGRSGRGSPEGYSAPEPGRPAGAAHAPPPIDTPLAFDAGEGLNPLVNAASTLIAVFERTRQSMSHPDVGGLHQRLVQEVRNFEAQAREQGIRQEIILSARYLLCTILDEAVMNTPWGSESAWSQRSLLTVFHSETSGGEKCFLILDRMRQSPAENLDILELFYICLGLGFEGKYRVSARGRDELHHIRDELFATIRRYRGDYERSLSTRWQGLGNTGKSLAEFIPMWVVASLVATVLFFGYGGFRYWLYNSATPVAQQLGEIADASPEQQDP